MVLPFHGNIETETTLTISRPIAPRPQGPISARLHTDPRLRVAAFTDITRAWLTSHDRYAAAIGLTALRTIGASHLATVGRVNHPGRTPAGEPRADLLLSTPGLSTIPGAHPLFADLRLTSTRLIGRATTQCHHVGRPKIFRGER